MIRNKRSDKTNKNRGLEQMVLIGIAGFATLLTTVCLVAGISEYLIHTFELLKREASHELALVLKNTDTGEMEELFAETKAIYEEVADDYEQDDAYPGGDDKARVSEYSDHFKSVMDERYEKLKAELFECREATEMEDIAFTFFDEKRDRLVAVADGDIKANCYTPGQWREGNIPTGKRMSEISVSEYALDVQRGSFGGWSVTDYITIYDSEGNPIGYASVFWDITDVMHQIRRFILIALPIIIILVSIFAHVIASILRNRLVRKVLAIADAARLYSQMDATTLETSDSVFEKLEIESPRELNELSVAMKSMERTVADDLKQIRQMTASKERFETELAVARNIQMSLLPEVTDEISKAPEYDIFGVMNPAHEVGGDFYDFFMIDKDNLAFLVADVSDKGAGAAMFMAVSRSMIRMRAQMGGSPSEIVSDVDQILSENRKNKMFVTIWMGILNLGTGEIAACNAGHDYPALRKKDSVESSEFMIYRHEHGSPLCFLPGLPFPEIKIRLKKGDRIFLYTDGVNEAHDCDGGLFGVERMINVLNEHSDMDIESLVLALKSKVDDFSAGTEQFDDITILGLEYNGR